LRPFPQRVRGCADGGARPVRQDRGDRTFHADPKRRTATEDKRRREQFPEQTSISAATVSKLAVAWTMPLTASGIYGTFAANPVTSPDGTV
jgi:hypothetical protein